MKPFYIPAFILLLCISCKKDKDVAITEENIAGTYSFVKVTFKPDGGGSEAVVTDAYLSACTIDDLQTFEVDGDYIYDDAGVQCAGDEQGSWSLNSATSISIRGSDYDLVSFNGSVLVVSQDTDHLGVDGALRFHLKK
jgi:hypothetical protein